MAGDAANGRPAAKCSGTHAALGADVVRIWFVVALGAGACYAPATPDCVLSCEADSDCVSDQVCTADQLCGPPCSGTCSARTASDAGTVDAATNDSGPPPDATPSEVTVTIQIQGGGSVDASPGTNCPSGTCQFQVPVSTPITLTAIDHGNNRFEMWTTSQCAGQSSVCHFAPASSTTVGVTFGHAH